MVGGTGTELLAQISQERAELPLGHPGAVALGLYKGNVRVLDRRSPFSLYDISIGGFTMGSDYNQKDAEGFINILGLPVKMAALKAAGRTPVQRKKK